MRLPRPQAARMRSGQIAFTLIEMMVSVALMTMVLGGVIYSHIMGGRLMQFTSAKLGANDSARKAFGKLQDEIRAAKTIKVGNGSASSFVVATNGAALQGRALQIYPGTNTNWWIRYFYVTNSSELRRVTASNGTPQLIASYVTNAVLFSKEDYLGTTLTTDTGNSALNVRLQFYQLSYPMTRIGTNNFFDYYQLQTRITRRTLD
ncbi:MAG: prepilin-type N-terminal cleavage/methylation domain-containing protein [Limisphaerales bacterium]